MASTVTVKKRKYNYNIYGGANGMPPQTVSLNEKGSKEWQYACMDFFDYVSAQNTQERMADMKKLKIVSGEFSITDYKYVTDPLSLGDKKEDEYGTTPDIVHYPIMIRPINTIIGEYIKRITQLHGFYAKNESQSAKNEYFRVKGEMIKQWARAKVMQGVYRRANAQGIPQNDPGYDDAIAKMTPEEIQEYADRNYVDTAESITQTLLKNMWKRETLDDEFVDGFKFAVQLAKEFYHIYNVNSKTKIQNLSPLDVFYQKSNTIKWISQGQYAGFRWYLTPSSIIDMFYDKLTVNDIQDLETLVNPNAQSRSRKRVGNGADSISYDTSTYSNVYGEFAEHNVAGSYDMIADYQRFGSGGYYGNYAGLVKVVRAYWKSYRKVGFLHTYDQNDKEVIDLVDEYYEPRKELGEWVKWQYINQVYTGAKLGNDIYVDIGPYQDQILDLDNLEYSPLPIEGCIFNNTNAKPMSYVDLMIPWNELYNITAYELKKDMNSALGKVLFMSIDHIPNIPGFDMKKWLYWAREFKIAWVKQPKNGPNTFNQFSSADMSFANQIVAKMDVLERIKIECDSIAGFAPGRTAGSTQTETLGQSTQQLVASVNQTEYVFFKHSKLLERVLNQALNLQKKALKKSDCLRNLFDDYEQAFIEYDIDDYLNEKVAVFVTNSTEDQRKRQQLESLMQPAMQNGADFVDLSDMLLAETIGEVKTIANKLRRKLRENNSAAQEAKQRELDLEENRIARDSQDRLTIAREKNATDLQREYIKTFGYQDNNLGDSNDDGMADIFQWSQFNSKQQDMMRKHGLSVDKLNFEKQKHRDEVVLKEKDQNLKKKQIEASLKNKVVGEK